MRDSNNSPDVFQAQKLTSEYIDLRIAEVLKHYEDRIEIIRNINDKYFQLLCFFSLLDSLSQEYSNYSQEKEHQRFANFILGFQKKWDFLEYTDPITLYYDVQEHLNETVNLDFLTEGNVYSPTQMIESGITERIVDCLASKGLQNIEDYKRKHRYVNLLFKMRSKIAHELSTPNSVLPMGLGEVEPLPYYMAISGKDIIKENDLEESWELVIPVEFIEQLLRECLNNYLDYCYINQKDPFENNKLERKYRLAWYD